MKLVLDLAPKPGNGRNSEGSFIRMQDGGILFAYSRYNSNGAADEDGCDIAVVRSYDEGETWSEPEIVVKAEYFGVANIMSVSCVQQEDGSIGIYFCVKENDGTTNIGRALSSDGKHFHTWERCAHNATPYYYTLNNDRVERFSNGKLVVPLARWIQDIKDRLENYETVIMVSEDDGKSFQILPFRFCIPTVTPTDGGGLLEPGIMEHKDGSIRLWMRTRRDCQYESYSYDGMKSFTLPAPSFFTSPSSPMELARNEETGILYAIHNPYPESKLANRGWNFGRSPLVIRKSLDDGKTWSKPMEIEGGDDRGLCYASMFFTKDNSMLCAYCRGSRAAHDPNLLARLGIMKIDLDEIV